MSTDYLNYIFAHVSSRTHKIPFSNLENLNHAVSKKNDVVGVTYRGKTKGFLCADNYNNDVLNQMCHYLGNGCVEVILIMGIVSHIKIQVCY